MGGSGLLDSRLVSPFIKEAEEYKPRPTIGPVPRRVKEYVLTPLSLPKTPDYAKNKQTAKLAMELLDKVNNTSKTIDLLKEDPWIRKYQWSLHPYFGWGHKVRLALPGFGTGLIAFGIYLGLEYTGIIGGDHKDSHHH